MPIYQLLYKEGTNLFENVKIPAENSVDGQEHIVNSQEEFIKYYHKKRKGFLNIECKLYLTIFLLRREGSFVMISLELLSEENSLDVYSFEKRKSGVF